MPDRNWTDYSKDVRLAKSTRVRVLLKLGGGLALILAMLGIFLPVLPTTPFLLLAAACYARSSAHFYNRLLNNRIFGRYILQWRETRTIPLRAKVTAVSLIVMTLGSSIALFIPGTAPKVIAGLIGASVILYLIRIPTRIEPIESRALPREDR